MNQCRNMKSYLYYVYCSSNDRYDACETNDRDTDEGGTCDFFSEENVITYAHNYQTLVRDGEDWVC